VIITSSESKSELEAACLPKFQRNVRRELIALRKPEYTTYL